MERGNPSYCTWAREYSQSEHFEYSERGNANQPQNENIRAIPVSLYERDFNAHERYGITRGSLLRGFSIIAKVFARYFFPLAASFAFHPLHVTARAVRPTRMHPTHLQSGIRDIDDNDDDIRDSLVRLMSLLENPIAPAMASNVLVHVDYVSRLQEQERGLHPRDEVSRPIDVPEEFH